MPLLDQPGVKLSKNANGLPLLELTTELFDAVISLSGAQLLAFRLHDQQGLLYVSPQAELGPEKVIRGGVPVCWPWFGPHPEDASAPLHGIARTAIWQLKQISRTGEGFLIDLKGPSLGDLSAEIRFTLGKEILIELTTHNHGSSVQAYTAALHTYLAIGNAEQASVKGLQNTRYLDKVSKQTGQYQEDTVSCVGEIDRIVYTSGPLNVVDQAWKRQISVDALGSNSMVLWNPGVIKARAIGDLPDDGWRAFICVESANAGEDSKQLAPGAVHTLGTRITTIPL
jgi:glucose-6-phosphate 1-epimerase